MTLNDVVAGYSLTSGFYNGQSSGEYVAIGAPRYNLEGAVSLYKYCKLKFFSNE